MSQVLIVGAGPTGLALANELARRQITFRLVDKAEHGCREARATSIHSKTMEIFDAWGCVQAFLERGQKHVRSVTYVPPRREIARLELDSTDSRYNFLLSLEQRETESILTDHLLPLKPERGVELLDFADGEDGVLARLGHSDGRQEEIKVDYLVGCDGAHSKVRHSLAEVQFEGLTDPQDITSADVFLNWDLSHDTSRFFLSEAGTLATFPLPQGRHLITAELHEPGGVPSLQDLQSILDERGPGQTRVEDLRWVTRFHVNSRQATRYRVGRIFLAGDAAHVQSPYGAKGMNTGIQDAYNLGWKLALVVQGKARPELLETYHPERHHAGRETLRFSMEAQLGLMQAQYQPGRTEVVRPAFLRSTYSGKQKLVQDLSEVALSYRNQGGHWTDHRGRAREWTDRTGRHSEHAYWKSFSEAPHAGDRAPDVDFLDSAGQPRQLYDLLRDGRHHLLLLQGAHQSQQSDDHLCQLAGLFYKLLGELASIDVFTHQPLNLPAGAHNFTDSRGHVHSRYGGKEDTLYWVRPDGYIGFRSQPAEAAPLLDYLKAAYPF